jgi:GxxExxY protein
MITITPKVDDLVGRIIGGAIQVHRSLGPGLLESVYRECLTIELTKQGLSAVPERTLPVFYDSQRLASKLRIDLLVDDVVVVEIKAVERFHPVHLAQVITYLKLSGCPAGLLLNFNTTALRQGGIRRVSHPDIYAKRRRQLEDADVISPP